MDDELNRLLKYSIKREGRDHRIGIEKVSSERDRETKRKLDTVRESVDWCLVRERDNKEIYRAE